MEARGLAKADRFGLSDPYVVLRVNKHKQVHTYKSTFFKSNHCCDFADEILPPLKLRELPNPIYSGSNSYTSTVFCVCRCLYSPHDIVYPAYLIAFELISQSLWLSEGYSNTGPPTKTFCLLLAPQPRATSTLSLVRLQYAW